MQLSDVYQLAQALMDQHGLQEWDFAFDRAVRRFGCCHYAQKRITLSKELTLLNTAEDVKDVILHEIAHALEPRQGHNRQWKRRAMSIGCKPERCYGVHVKKPPAKYVGTCPNCQRRILSNRRSHISCGRCCRVYNPKYCIRWQEYDDIN
jgi:predicted SprT family Zn-dependent metalloprotease